MARALRIQFPGAFYHITCRGIEQRSIYLDNGDRLRFLELLTRSLDTYVVVMHAYIMMNNHFHLLVETKKANCSEFMRHFNVSYTGWFNWRHGRRGNLYQGRYNACLIDADRFLLEVSRYIHLNIVRVKRWQSSHHGARWRAARSYQWSSLAGYIDRKSAKDYVYYPMILEMVGGRRAYGRYVIDGLKRGVADPFKKVQRRMILGTEDFVAEVKHYLRRGSLRDQPAYREFVLHVLEPEVLLGFLARECGITTEVLRTRKAHGVTRGLVAELLYKYCQITQAQIGKLLGGIDYGAVYLLRRRIRENMRTNVELKKRYDEIDTRVSRLM
ncbi:transposase [candidate division WOR-3 bacterium]|nr:transposase [candidate division WOR-3 bacterium]